MGNATAAAGAARPKTILVVEDDQSFLAIIAGTIRSSGYNVVTANDGKSAQSILGVQECSLVITDVRMPGMHGIELLHWIKRTLSVPVVLMTGFGEINETQEAAELKADGFIPKPFQKKDLLATIEGILGSPAAEVSAAGGVKDAKEEVEYCRLRIEDFVSGSRIPYSIYVKLADSRYVRLGYKGEDLSADRIRSYKDKGVEFLYLRKEDFREYVGFSLRIAKELKGAASISKEKKQHFLRLTGELLLDHIFIEGVDEENYETAKAFVETSAGILADQNEILNLLIVLNNHGDFLYAHSVAVSMISVMVGKKMGWHSSGNVFKLAMSGLLHDIGKKEIDRAILNKPRAEMSMEEVKVYESHSMRGMEILSTMDNVPFDVLQIVLQHHEDCVGTGFPRGIRRAQIHPLARLLAVADLFCSYAIKSPKSAGMSAKDAISRMESFHANLLEAEAFLGLKKLFKLA